VERADLEMVVALAEEGSVTAAAGELHTAQPALSRRLARLEHAVGGPLFVRGRGGATPTAAGRVLAERARDALAAIERAERDAADAVAGRRGRLRIGMTPTIGADLLPEVLATLRDQHPDIRLELETTLNSRGLRAAVRAGQLDLAAVVLDPDDHEGLRVVAQVPQVLVVAVPSGHPLAQRRAVRPAQLVDEPLVTVEHGQGMRSFVERLFAEIGTAPTITIETNQRELLLPLVAAGAGITILPEVFARWRAGAGVAVRPFSPARQRRVGAVARAGPTDALVAAAIGAVQATWPRLPEPTRPG
jgi:DNA-binding transcriptional LysR family regulator